MIVVALNYTCCTNQNVLAVFFLSSFLSFSFLIFILSSYLHSVILWFHWQALRFVSEASGGNYIWICCCCCYWSCFGAKRHGTLACVSALVMYNLNVSITALLPSPLTPHNPDTLHGHRRDTLKGTETKEGEIDGEKKNTQSWVTTVKKYTHTHDISALLPIHICIWNVNTPTFQLWNT